MIVSDCCLRPVTEGVKVEYPLGGRAWGIRYKIDVCERCGEECEPIEVCEMCGEPECECEEEIARKEAQEEYVCELERSVEDASYTPR